GSGKSTMIRCINRLIEATQGEILLEGRDILKYNREELRELRQNHMSMVFQRFALFPHRTVRENAAYGLEIRGVDKSERFAEAERWLNIVGLTDWADSYPRQLSGGMQQRVGIARALCTDPEILLMVEPFSALDPLIRREMQDELVELQSRLNKTIIFITHDLDEALRLGDRIAILKDGMVQQVGTPEEILTSPINDYVADFTQDVNRVRVLTAQTIMIKPRPLQIDRGGPRVALKFMEEQGMASVFVVDRHRRLLGMLTMEEAILAVQEDLREIEPLLNH
ncbi:MAG: glycine betaine/L-proline ABC transporter ATP-binding protein, partial [Anaerolineae bacterium]